MVVLDSSYIKTVGVKWPGCKTIFCPLSDTLAYMVFWLPYFFIRVAYLVSLEFGMLYLLHETQHLLFGVSRIFITKIGGCETFLKAVPFDSSSL